MKQKKSFVFFIIFCITILFIQTTLSRNKKLKEISQESLFSFRHYPKFLGDKNTIYGNFYDRSYILGFPLGFRKKMSERGIYLDATVFQFLGSNIKGGAKHDYLRYNGNAEYWLIIDTAKTGLWSRGAFLLHAETSWTVQDSINDDVGSLLASNARSQKPVPNSSKTTLSEVALEQYLSDHFLFRAGKIDATGPIEATNFANNSRFQFTYAGLVNNPIISHFTSYTSLALLPIWIPNKKNKVLFFIADAEGTAEKSSLDTAFNGHNSYCIQYVFSPIIKENLPGNYRILYAHNRKPITSYELDDRHIIGENIRTTTIQKKCNNYALLVNFDQYVWIDKDNANIKHRNYLQPVGLMLFGRAGWEPKDRNVIDQFYSIGIGSYGGFRNRYYDQWGFGYAATHISCKLRKDLKEQNVLFHNFEHAFEFFYNIELTPALHFTINSQIIRPPLKSRKPAFVISSRLQTDF